MSSTILFRASTEFKRMLLEKQTSYPFKREPVRQLGTSLSIIDSLAEVLG